MASTGQTDTCYPSTNLEPSTGVPGAGARVRQRSLRVTRVVATLTLCICSNAHAKRPAPHPQAPAEQAPAASGAAATPVPDSLASWEWVRNWLTLSIQQDLVFHSKLQSACSAGSPYLCFNAAKTPTELMASGAAPGGNQISSSGALVGTLRFLIGFDRVVNPHLSLGVRLGSVISGKALTQPQESPVLALHGEARLAIWVGRNVFSRAGFRPYLLLSGGVAEADGKITVDYQLQGDPRIYKLDAWKRSGHTFVSPGLGFQAAFTKHGGPLAEFRYMQFLSPSVPVLGLQLGYSVGF